MGAISIKQLSKTTGLQFAARGLTVIISWLIARELSPENYGRYAYLLSVANVLFAFPMAGIPHIIIKNMPIHLRLQEKSNVNGLIIFSFLYASVIIIFVAMYLFFFGIDVSFYITLILFLFVVFKAYQAILAAILNSFSEPVKSLAVINFISPFIMILAMLPYLFITRYTESDYVHLFLINCMSVLISCFIGIYLIKGKINEFTFKNVDIKYEKWAKELPSFILIVLLYTINNEISIIVLSNVAGEASAGYFRVAMQVVSILVIFQTAIGVIVQSKISNLYETNNYNEIKKITRKSNLMSMLIMLPFLSIMISLPDFVIEFIFGGKYSESANALRILAFGYIPYAIFGHGAMVLNMSGGQKYVMFSTLIMLIANMASMCIFIPELGQDEAAIAFSISFFMFHILIFFIYKYRLKKIENS
ncbi:oligosaccharide flippase family protein [Vibrio vulnificus]